MQGARASDSGIYKCQPNNAPEAQIKVHILIGGKLFKEAETNFLISNSLSFGYSRSFRCQSILICVFRYFIYKSRLHSNNKFLNYNRKKTRQITIIHLEILAISKEYQYHVKKLSPKNQCKLFKLAVKQNKSLF